ncbi:LytTR family DNA-binding domain-containing protein [Massilimicrobiota sp. An134]|uniref:LytR/AlgR family response regulator transcription factor n=1 Tax=Massilimicrobiota sp. An134 TaxID=1965557 RepID=UPI000B368CE1|nr:LytTR family DNA-binding domain-containing protein [Massilimicrobiota sp. An134]OUQ28783.1 hypothetical protein B5E79_09240 [Massilimicrobiota sp. An134]
MNIILQCEVQYTQILKRYFNTYFQNITYIQYNNHLVNAIFIKQIRSIQDIKEMETLSFYHLDFIFLIENGEYMFELLEYNPLTFVRLSHIEKDIIHLIEILQYKERGLGTILNFKSGYQTIRINSQRIEYIESYGHYVFIHTESATFKVREKLSQILRKLKPLGFIQIHKSYIINKAYIQKKTSTYVYMNSHTCLPIGQKYKSQLK